MQAIVHVVLIGCAWVVWYMHLNDRGWEVRNAFPTHRECLWVVDHANEQERDMAAEQKRAQSFVARCLPDTIDPRQSKPK